MLITLFTCGVLVGWELKASHQRDKDNKRIEDIHKVVTLMNERKENETR